MCVRRGCPAVLFSGHFCQVVAADEADANEAAAVAQAIKDECEGELEKAIPDLEASIAALNTIKSSDISEMKAMKVQQIAAHTPLTHLLGGVASKEGTRRYS